MIDVRLATDHDGERELVVVNDTWANAAAVGLPVSESPDPA